MTQWIAFLRRPLQWPPYTLLVVAAVLATVLIWGWALEFHEPHREVVLERAEFSYEGGPSRPVSLPHNWAQDGLPRNGFGEYRLNISRDQVSGLHHHDPSHPEALSICMERVAGVRAVWLNGQLLSSTRSSRNAAGVPVMAVVDLPWSLLRPGDNELRIQVDYRSRGGLSSVHVGPTLELRHEHSVHQVLAESLPTAVNMAAAGISVFLLLVWAQRRHDRSLLVFPLLTLITSLRNGLYFVSPLLLDPRLVDAALFVGNVWAVVLLVDFVLLQRKHHGEPVPARPLRRLAWTLCLAAPVLWLLAEWVELLVMVRAVVYPVLLLVSVWSAWVLWGLGRRHHQRVLQLASVSFAGVVAAGVHDYLLIGGWLPITDAFWLPLATPLPLTGLSFLFAQQLIRALSQVEQQNAELESRVQDRTRELQYHSQMKSQFLAAASHDLRQPLVSIGLMLTLARSQEDRAHRDVLLDKMESAISSMETLLNGLLDLSRLESGAVEPKPQVVDLGRLVRSLREEFEALARAKGVSLRWRTSGLSVVSDPLLLEQILRNLLSNALRYTAQGGILVSARKRGGQVLLQVWDTGCGIAPENQQRIFEAFVQLNQQANQGSGLGLAIVERAARLLQHPLGLRSLPGHGSCFSALLPRATPLPEAAAPRRKEAPAPSARDCLAGMSVVLVEDDESVRESLLALMQFWGVQAQALGHTADIEAWLRQADAPGPDVLISDYRLGQLNGIDVVMRARERFQRPLPALIITGDTSVQDLRKLESSGLPVLHKPFRSEHLLQQLQALAASLDKA